jgi:hypothetical protein
MCRLVQQGVIGQQDVGERYADGEDGPPRFDAGTQPQKGEARVKTKLTRATLRRSGIGMPADGDE